MSLYLLRALEAPLILGPLREGDAVRTAAEGARAALPVLVAALSLGPRRRCLSVAAAAEPEMDAADIQMSNRSGREMYVHAKWRIGLNMVVTFSLPLDSDQL